MTLKAPFIYFGGKSRIASLVWQRFGDVPNLVEPFAGSAAILFARPDSHRWWERTETINDADGFVCLAPETRLLSGDLRWRRSGEIQTGDVLVGFDEDNGGARPGLRAPERYRHWRLTEVTAVRRVVKPCYRLTFDDGTTVTASADHLWLGGSHVTGGRGWRWQRTDGLVCNRLTQRSWVLKLCDVAEEDTSREAGWLSGFFDGEGHLRNAPGWRPGVTQRLGPEQELAEKLLIDRGFVLNRAVRTRAKEHHSEVAHVEINGGMRETLRFLMTIRPERLIRAFQQQITAMSLYGRAHQAVGLVAKEFIGEQEVVAIETTSHTFVAEGLASHNCNFWRAVRADPDTVANWADWPVNENDLHARHAWLVGQRDSLAPQLEGDPGWFDPKIAGWWVWGINCWIGSGWCSGNGPWRVVDRQLVHLGSDGQGIHRQLVHLGDDGQGIHRKLVHLGDDGQGIHRKLVHLGNDGRGIHRKRVHLGDDGRGHCEAWGEHLREMMGRLSDRLRRVRVCSGDWSRVCGPTPTVKQGLTGVFLDPPYALAEREPDLYRVDGDISAAVRGWAIEHGDDPRLRIALCGYDSEHAMPDGWDAVPWKAHGGYGSQGDGAGRANAAREVIWFNRHCLARTHRQIGLFEATA